MPTTTDEFALAKSWIGTWEDKTAFDERYDRLEDLDYAILESMRSYRAQLVSQASSLSLDDGTSVTYTENIKAIDRLLEEFEAVGGTSGVPAVAANVTKLSRTSYR